MFFHSLYVRFYPHPNPDLPLRNSTLDEPILSPDTPGNPDPPSPSLQPGTVSNGAQASSSLPPVEVTYLEVPPGNSSHPSLLFQVDTPPPDPLESCPLRCTSHCVASEMFNDPPLGLIPYSEIMLHLTSTAQVSLPEGLSEDELQDLGSAFYGCQFVDRIKREEVDEGSQGLLYRPDLLIFASVISSSLDPGAPHALLSHSEGLPVVSSPITSDMFEIGSCSHFHHPGHSLIMPAPPADSYAALDVATDGEKMDMPGSYSQVSLHHTLTGWVAHLKDPEEDELVGLPPSVDMSQPSGQPNLQLLANAINHASAYHHPPLFEAVSYPCYCPTTSNVVSSGGATGSQLFQDIFGSEEYEFRQPSSLLSDELFL
ncbi:hypothetical protein EDD16DRAFT_1708574 [Pisolithus croceorrhizus]|nr:hypothetical protein EDD16DRAFT_1708574 [Pisolithus croceorrhizus]